MNVATNNQTATAIACAIATGISAANEEEDKKDDFHDATIASCAHEGSNEGQKSKKRRLGPRVACETADHKKLQSICTEVKTIINSATPDQMKKLLIAYPNLNATGCVKRGANFQARINAFHTNRTIRTFPNEEEAKLAIAIAEMKLGPKKKRKNRKTEAQKLKESVRVNSICVSCQCLSLYFCYNLTFIC